MTSSGSNDKMPIMSKETYELSFKSKASGASPKSGPTLDNCQVKLLMSKSEDTSNYKQASSLEPKSSIIADTKSVESTTSFFSESDKTSIDPSRSVKSLNDLPPCSKGDLIDDKTKQILCKKFGYEIGDKLGSGAYGEVYRATNRGLSDPKCAVKVINTRLLSHRARNEILPAELTALMEVKHPSIVQIHDIFRHKGVCFIFMECLEGGDMVPYLHKHQQLKESLVALWFAQTCEGLHYMHTDLHMAHRDIKLDNLLLDGVGNVKLTDLGFIFIGTKEDMYEQMSTLFCGTLQYQSPELVEEKEPYSPFLADVWALGVTLFALLTNKFPFQNGDIQNGNTEILAQQRNYPAHIRSQFHSHTSQPARDLVELIVNPVPRKRPLVAQILLNEFLVSSYSTQELSELL